MYNKVQTMEILDEYPVLSKTVVDIYELCKEVHEYQKGQMSKAFASNLEIERKYLQSTLKEFEHEHKLHVYISTETPKRRCAKHIIYIFRIRVNRLRNAIIYRTE